MGSGIAQVAAMGGYRTLLYDVDAAMVQKGLAAIEKSLQTLIEKNKLTPEQLARTQRTAVPFHVIINPKLTVAGNAFAQFFEGCLSVNGYGYSPGPYSQDAEDFVIRFARWYRTQLGMRG